MIYHEIFSVDDRRLPFFFSLQSPGPWSPDREARGNWHDELEILCFLEGVATVTSGDERLEARAGDVIVFNSNDIHKIMPVGGHVHYLCLIVSSSFCLEHYIDLGNTRFQVILRDQAISALMSELLECYPAGMLPGTTDLGIHTRALMSRCIVLQILTKLFCCYRESGAHRHSNNRNNNEKIKKALEYIHDNLHTDISLDEMSCISGLSKYHLSREFKRIVGFSFVQYLNFIRCEKAKRLLEDQRIPIGEICKRCGFSDLSYFSKKFLCVVGLTPTAYRKRQASTCLKAAPTV